MWTSIILFAAALVYFVLAGRRHPAPESRETSVFAPGREPESGSGQESSDSGQIDGAPEVTEASADHDDTPV